MRQPPTLRSRPWQTRRGILSQRELSLGRTGERHHRQSERHLALLSQQLLQSQTADTERGIMDDCKRAVRWLPNRAWLSRPGSDGCALIRAATERARRHLSFRDANARA